MDERDNDRILIRYYMFTVPQVSVFVGAILGVLFILKVDTILALGIFTVLYGIMLLAIHLIVYPHFSSSMVFKLGLLGSLLLILTGIYLISGYAGGFSFFRL